MTYPVVYSLPLTLQLCCKPLGILHSKTKSQKGNISSHDALQNLNNIDLARYRSQGSLREGNRDFVLPPSMFLGTIKNSYPGI